MTIPKHVQIAVQGLQDQDSFRAIQDPSVSEVSRDRVRTEKMQEMLDVLSATRGGEYGAHIQAEIRSGATFQEILSELKMMKKVDLEVADLGEREVRQMHGFKSAGQSAESVTIDDIKPDSVTKQTQEAYNAAQTAKAEKGQSATIET